MNAIFEGKFGMISNQRWFEANNMVDQHYFEADTRADQCTFEPYTHIDRVKH